MRAGQLASNCWKRLGDTHRCNCPKLGSASLHWAPGNTEKLRHAAGSPGLASAWAHQLPGTWAGQAWWIRGQPGKQGDSCWWPQHPYPSEEQKKQLSQDTGLTILQVNNW